ncbi:hypothetical protein DOM21_01265 [Bacteriovorax stolpii]|uniref:Uncharacterized protein n=1 Tax=Bacteriovorax stolpii TaxID=960 RepID=A0A2K9NWK2_BACTC|nr:hypothetical protein [Bacteriovorax stolpii]AUN99899.1 hypothetical protein C0V70_17665 [Bacteriovorax stolpii]QDK40108.1 hypothetical protein DOM21_01265 [Bacteriovorax stolpii]TDP54208.1 hypothetical protein C8D79_1501 [Bacteriovorax stolpii]
MKKLFQSKSGFTLLEITIAGGIAAAVALVAVSLLKTNEKSINRVIETTESSYIKNLIIGNMSNPEACRRTFAFPTPQPITRTALTLYSKNLQPFLAPGQQITESKGSNGSGAIKNLFTINTINSAAIAGTDKSLRLSINYTIANTLDTGSKKVNRNFEVDVYIQRDSTGTNVSSCFVDTAAMIKKAIENSCKGNGAVWDTSNNTCTHNVQLSGTQVTAGTTSVCPANQFLKKSVSASGITNYTCATYATGGASCASGFFMNGINPDGTPICIAFRSLFTTPGRVLSATTTGYQEIDLNCTDLPDGTQRVLRRWTSSGPDCVPKIIQKDCPPYQYINNVDSSGNVTCSAFTKNPNGNCAAGTYARSVNSDGSIPAGACQALTIPATCSSGYAINSINIAGQATNCIDRPY